MAAGTNAPAPIPLQLVSVLLVEDDAIIRMDMADLMAGLGWHVTEAGTADEALALVNGGLFFNLLLTDVHMPGLTDGYDLATFVRQTLPKVRIVMVSGEMKPEIGGPFDIFLSKPVQDISSVVQNLMHELSMVTVANDILLSESI